MAALLFSFSNDAKSFAGRFKDFHLGKADWDVRQRIIQKVPHRILTFTFQGKSCSHFSQMTECDGHVMRKPQSVMGV